MSKDFDGLVTISRSRSNFDNPRPIRIELRENDRKILLVIEMGLAEFADAAVGNLAYVPCTVRQY